jgi:hypothetical protein
MQSTRGGFWLQECASSGFNHREKGYAGFTLIELLVVGASNQPKPPRNELVVNPQF